MGVKINNNQAIFLFISFKNNINLQPGQNLKSDEPWQGNAHDPIWVAGWGFCMVAILLLSLLRFFFSAPYKIREGERWMDHVGSLNALIDFDKKRYCECRRL